MRTIFVVTNERDGSGQLDWYNNLRDAQTAFANAVFEAKPEDGQYLALFSMRMPEGMADHQILLRADTAMWACEPCYVNAILRCDFRRSSLDYGPHVF